MKIIFCFLALGFSIVSFAQISFYHNKPFVYLDSIQIDLEYYLFDQIKIARVDVVKNKIETQTNNSGSIYITSKHPQSFNFLSYEEIKRKYFFDNTKPILLLLNGNLIKSAAKINIDSSYIRKVEVDKGEDFKELKNIYPNMAVVNIELKNFKFPER